VAGARARGRLGGRPPGITEDKLAAARLTPTDKRPMHAIAKTLGVSHATLHRHLNLSAAELDGGQPA
jgi:DNA invertase Pin-like site-specific DNA recombinase